LNRPGAPRGVYLRHAKEVAAKQSFSVEVDPIFSTNDNVDAETQMKRVGFEMKMQLKATESFVDVPEFFMLMHNGRSFKFEVDPTKLDPGVHTAFIYGYDTTKPELGPRFHIPITIAKPIDEDVSISLGELEVSICMLDMAIVFYVSSDLTLALIFPFHKS
jgi:tripeptidyl-peptidase-2